MPDTHPIPVLCDLCRARGRAGDDPFAELAGLLDFEPVPVRSHNNNWTPEHQRAFIAALATTGNVRPAARAIGRYPAGAERLRKAPRGKSFAEAWDNALDLYHEREVAGLMESMGDLAAEHQKHADHAREIASAISYHRQPEVCADPPDPEAITDARRNIARKLWTARRYFLEEIASDPAKRDAWEVLTGTHPDWGKAANGEAQDDEVAAVEGRWPLPPSVRSADLLVPIEEERASRPADQPCENLPLPPEAPQADQPDLNLPALIEREQASERSGERVRDCREVDASELRARGFEAGPGGVWVKRL